MRPPLRCLQRPKTFHHIDVSFIKAVPIIVLSIFTGTMTDVFIVIKLLAQAAVNVFAAIDTSIRYNIAYGLN